MLEARLAWLVHIIAAVLKGRLLSSSSAESQEALDGDLAARVFALASAADGARAGPRAGAPSRARLDLALLAFFQAFRKVYVGEQVMHSSRVYARLAERVGLADHGAVLGAMLAAVRSNLRSPATPPAVVTSTLALFHDLAAGYMSGKLLLQLDATAALLAGGGGADAFPFLADPAHARARTAFYATLARLLFMDDTPAKFRAFVAPLQAVLAAVGVASRGGVDPAALRAGVPQAAVAGVLRDLRGIAQATNSRRTYGLLFDWLHPAHLAAVVCALEAWAPDPALCTPALKFLAEFVLNKSQRLTFDASSPNGILLFRQVSKALVAHGTRALAAPPPADVYADRYKGIAACLTTLTRCLAGGYVNFGVFALYGDPCLRDALDVCLRMALSIPLPDVLAYRKAGGRSWGWEVGDGGRGTGLAAVRVPQAGRALPHPAQTSSTTNPPRLA